MEPVVVEVKSVLRQGLSLFTHMMDTVNELRPGQSLIIKSTFNPRPLVSQMRRRGYSVHQEKVGRTIVTTFTPGEARGTEEGQPSLRADTPIQGPEEFLDNRGLVPPEPMQRTLRKLEEVDIGTVVVIHNDRVPVFLLGQLDDEGYPYETAAQPDDSAIVRILKTH
ncbi:MAG: DUF2249 domain-containing protein [Firmicutes bacterium]|jgi:hypothetical protein|uniref:Universal stress protein n=1 Tax=Sulfobacillus benefaciens TaxID=453960 RepID=A0A2T2X9K9_9FIRM|nr:DUF2249 domain-containing protein [Bacillota bacterium]MCL5013179.1 DUF2249 domain-containing protein [Bacillota bacterium]PSR31175.1 MAG: universal stress protein [Sulfobacillus benefaciens]HBQ96472.1 universal stress protein [Sulfobacillus sp.]